MYIEHWNIITCRTKRAYKVALRRCKRDRNRIIRDKLANSLLIKNGKEFWKEIDKLNNVDNVALSANVMDGIEGQANLASLWRDKYSKVYNRGYADEHDKLAVHEWLDGCEYVQNKGLLMRRLCLVCIS